MISIRDSHPSVHYGSDGTRGWPERLSQDKIDTIRATLKNDLESGVHHFNTYSKDEIARSASDLSSGKTPISAHDVETFISLELGFLDKTLSDLNLPQGYHDPRVFENFVSSHIASVDEKLLAKRLYGEVLYEKAQLDPRAARVYCNFILPHTPLANEGHLHDVLSSPAHSRTEQFSQNQLVTRDSLAPNRLANCGISPDAMERVINRAVEITIANSSVGQKVKYRENVRVADAERIKEDQNQIPFNEDVYSGLAERVKYRIRTLSLPRVNQALLIKRGISPGADERVIEEAMKAEIADGKNKQYRLTYVVEADKKRTAALRSDGSARVPFTLLECKSLTERIKYQVYRQSCHALIAKQSGQTNDSHTK